MKAPLLVVIASIVALQGCPQNNNPDNNPDDNDAGDPDAGALDAGDLDAGDDGGDDGGDDAGDDTDAGNDADAGDDAGTPVPFAFEAAFLLLADAREEPVAPAEQTASQAVTGFDEDEHGLLLWRVSGNLRNCVVLDDGIAISDPITTNIGAFDLGLAERTRDLQISCVSDSEEITRNVHIPVAQIREFSPSTPFVLTGSQIDFDVILDEIAIDACKIDDRPANDVFIVEQDHTFNLTCAGFRRNLTAEATVEAFGIHSFTSGGTSVIAGSTVDLSWSTSHADRCVLTTGDLQERDVPENADGFPQTINATTTFILDCFGGGFTQRRILVISAQSQ